MSAIDDRQRAGTRRRPLARALVAFVVGTVVGGLVAGAMTRLNG